MSNQSAENLSETTDRAGTDPQAQTQQPETDAAKESSLRELAKHFTLEESVDSEAPAETRAGEKKPVQKVKPKTLSDLAERLELEVKDLYDIAIPSDKLEGLTLGKLKDHMSEREDFTVRSLRFEEDKRRQEAEFLRASQELQILLDALPKDAVRPEVREAARQKQAQYLKSERSRTLDVIPEWKDETTRENELAGIVEHLSSYGFPQNYLATIADHRTLKVLRDFWRQTQQLQRALELVSEKRPNGVGKSKPAAKPQRPTQPKSRSLEERRIAQMLGALSAP